MKPLTYFVTRDNVAVHKSTSSSLQVVQAKCNERTNMFHLNPKLHIVTKKMNYIETKTMNYIETKTMNYIETKKMNYI